jgi:hypothetical protein
MPKAASPTLPSLLRYWPVTFRFRLVTLTTPATPEQIEAQRMAD